MAGALEDKRMSRILKWLLVAFLVVIAAGIIMPWLARDAHDGSKKYARIWRDQLLACESLEDVTNRFTCFEIEETPEGRLECVPETEPTAERPWALIKSFPDGKWVACVHSPTHGHPSIPGGGTAVSRDSEGVVHVYFGHICDRLWATGETFEEFQEALASCYTIKEIQLR